MEKTFRFVRTVAADGYLQRDDSWVPVEDNFLSRFDPAGIDTFIWSLGEGRVVDIEITIREHGKGKP